jgi:hypothetical protein
VASSGTPHTMSLAPARQLSAVHIMSLCVGEHGVLHLVQALQDLERKLRHEQRPTRNAAAHAALRTVRQQRAADAGVAGVLPHMVNAACLVGSGFGHDGRVHVVQARPPGYRYRPPASSTMAAACPMLCAVAAAAVADAVLLRRAGMRAGHAALAPNHGELPAAGKPLFTS